MIIQEERICQMNAALLRDAQSHWSGPALEQIRNYMDTRPQHTEFLEPLLNFAGLAHPPAGESPTPMVPENLTNLFASRSERFRQFLNPPQPEQCRFGQIWTTKLWIDGQESSAEEHEVHPRIIVLLEDASDSEVLGERFLLAAPISVDIAYRCNYDLLVFEQESPLGYPFMIEGWNAVSPLHMQLGRCLGTLQQPLKRFLGLVYQAYLGMSVDLSEVAQHLGPAILHPHDPRLSFQEQEIEACEYLRRPLLELLRKADKERTQSKPQERVVLSLPDVLVKRGRFPYERSSSGKIRLQVAATQEEELPSYFIQASYPGGEIVGKLIRDYDANALSLYWEGVAPELQGKLVRVKAHTKAGQTLAAGEQPIQQGTSVLLVAEAKVALSQVESLSLEILDKVEQDGIR